MTTCTGSSASISAFGDGGAARNRRVDHSSTACTGKFVKGSVHARIAVSLVAEHLTGVDATLQLLSAGQGADMRFQCRHIALLALRLVLGRAASVGALVFAACSETSAGTFTSRKFVAIKTHVRADALHLGRSATTVDRHRDPTRCACSQMALLHAAMSTVQWLLTHASTAWNGIHTRGPDPALHDCLNGFGPAGTSRDDLRSRRALSWFTVLGVARLGTFVMTARKRSMNI